MSVLEQFEKRNYGKPKGIYFTLSKNGVSFSKETLRILGAPEFVDTFLSPQKRQFAIQACDYHDGALPFVTGKAAKATNFVRWKNQMLMDDLLELMHVEYDETKNVRCYGEYFRDENVVIYDLTAPEVKDARTNS